MRGCLQVQTPRPPFPPDTSLSLLPRVNLYELMKSSRFQGFSLSVVRRFTLSVLKCLQMLRLEKIIHCDLKPVSMTSVPPGAARPGRQVEARQLREALGRRRGQWCH